MSRCRKSEIFCSRTSSTVCEHRRKMRIPSGEAANGFKLTAQILDYPGGMPGTVGLTLSWG